MNRTLFVGDLHCKYHILERVIELSEKYDKVIFLGDYVDDWFAVPEASYNLLNRLIEYKKSKPKKVITLLANHDCSEWFGRPFACSGYNPLTSNLVKPLFEQNENLFDIVYVDENNSYICSHAGFTNNYLRHTLRKNFRSPKQLSKYINRAFHNRFDYESPHQQEYERVFYSLADAGAGRGGVHDPSPLWADKSELAHDWWPHTQIVGHSPVKTITFHDRDDKEIYFCDTFSTYQDGSHIGDCSLLAFENNYPAKIDLDGNEIDW